MGRVVQPELLDGLPHDDPETIRSRRDLRMINGLMGNFHWMRKRVPGRRETRVVELGAGDGALLNMLCREGRQLVGVDRAPRPERLAEEIEWVQGDVREVLGKVLRAGDTVIANLLLHQFEDRELGEMGRALQRCEEIRACEPLRSRRALAQGTILWPLLNRVTRYDMRVSVRAGFRRGELPDLLGLDGEWQLEERCTLRGAYRLSARRRRR